MSVTKSEFGKMPDGSAVELYTLANKHGTTAKLTTYGARLTELHCRDKQGRLGNVVLGYDNFEQYLQPQPYFGCTVGRVANRIGGAQFTLDGVTYKLAANNGKNTLHGGAVGFDKRIWKAEAASGEATVRFRYTSPDMEEGFSGAVQADVAYRLSDDDELWIEYTAEADKATPVNLTNHTYFNLKGPGDGTILDHILMLNADRYTPVNDELIPTGEVKAVKGTPMDFTTPTAIGSRIEQVKGGYDHNYCINGRGGDLTLAARLSEPGSGRVLEVHTTQPGVQFYSGNFLNGSLHGNGGVYVKHGGLCLETQGWPDAVHHSSFPPVILRPGGKYRETARYKFSRS